MYLDQLELRILEIIKELKLKFSERINIFFGKMPKARQIVGSNSFVSWANDSDQKDMN